MHFIYFCLIGLVAGWLAGIIVKGSGYGILGDLVIGVLGAIIGGWLFMQLGIPLPIPDLAAQLVVATIGALVLIFLVRLIKRA